MKKKLLWIAALLAALALLVTGCPTGGGDDDDDDDDDGKGNGGDGTIILTDVFSDTPKTQSKAVVTITESTVTFSFTGGELWGEIVTPEEARWDASAYSGIQFDYKATGNTTIFAQDTNSIFIFGFNGSDGWGAINMTDKWESLTLPFSILQRQTWFGEDQPFNKSAIIKLCFQISDGNTSDKKFEIRNFAGYK